MALARRGFLGGVALASAGVLGWPFAAPAQAKLETTSVRMFGDPSTCVAPQYVAEALLRDEGFTDIRYVDVSSDAEVQTAVAQGKVDFAMDFALKYVSAIDAGMPLTVLAGIHVGCFELFAHANIRNIRDLNGKKIGADAIGSSATAFLVSLGTAIGFDATRDVQWVTGGSPSPLELFANGELDAFLAHPPGSAASAHARHRPCHCQQHHRPAVVAVLLLRAGGEQRLPAVPVACKSVVRALLRAADICAADPVRVARKVVDRGGSEDYDATLATLRDIPYGKWRNFSAEDTMRFYALRLHEAGLIKSTPAKLIAKGTDWRFLNDVKQELKM